MQFILVRHGKSIQNIGEGLDIINQKSELSEKGILQTDSAVNSIIRILNDASHKSVTVLYSPYERTLEMAKRLKNKGVKADFIEEPLVSEIQCGDFEGITLDLYEELDLEEYNSKR